MTYNADVVSERVSLKKIASQKGILLTFWPRTFKVFWSTLFSKWLFEWVDFLAPIHLIEGWHLKA